MILGLMYFISLKKNKTANPNYAASAQNGRGSAIVVGSRLALAACIVLEPFGLN